MDDKKYSNEQLAMALIGANRCLSKLEAENRSLKSEIAELKLKADRFDEMVEKRLLKSFAATADELGLDKDTLVSFLISRKYLSCDAKGNPVPHKCFITDGIFVVKEDKAEDCHDDYSDGELYDGMDDEFGDETDDNEDCGTDRNIPSETHIFITPKGVETFRLLTKLFLR